MDDDRARLPSREEIRRFVEESPGRVGKREIARAFGISGGDRIALKRLLAEMAEEGEIARRGKRLRSPGRLPKVFVLALTGRDEDGELIGEPVDWDADEDGPPPTVLIAEGPKRPGQPPAGVGDRALVRLVDREAAEGDGEAAPLPLAKVVKVIDRKPPTALAVVRRTPFGARLLPVEKKQREIEIDHHALGDAEDGELVRVEVRRIGRYKETARILDRVGPVNSERAVSMIAIEAHGIPHVFPNPVLAEAEAAAPFRLEGGKAEDWRDVPFVTIDPPDAKDHDDAVFARPDEDPNNAGGHVVFVAIADVARYVRPGSALDREALHRGNSVYFPDRVVPMLPERISNDLCSLRPHALRPALAVAMTFGKDGRKRRHAFHRIAMRSAARLSYAQAQAAIDGAPDETTAPLMEGVLAPLWEAWRCVNRGREAREPLELDIPERKIVVGPDGAVEAVKTPERLDAHRLIEEFMIQANVSAAETCEKAKIPLIYRVHDAPSPEKLLGLSEFLASLDIRLPKTGNLRPAQFNRILERLAETEHAQVASEVVLRSQAQAEYDPLNIGHFGLNLKRYAHFTSPIRRYADLVVHRALIRAGSLGKDGLTDGEIEALEKTAVAISATERRAMAAERSTVDRLVAMWMADHVGATFAGRIGGVTRAGLFVTLAETGADGFVPISTLGNDYYTHVEEAHALVGEATGETFRLGDPVTVKIVEAAPFQGALRFEVVDHEATAGPPAGRRPRARSGRARGRPAKADRGRPKAARKGRKAAR